MWTEELFHVRKPVIALLHIRALPGDPLYDNAGGMNSVVEIAKRELDILQNGGVDGILFANEFSLPYQPKVDYVTVAAFARVIGELKKELSIPYGVNIAANPLAAVDLGIAVDANFVRAAFTGAYVGEAGITTTDIASTIRRRMYLNRTDMKLLFKVNPESDVYLAERDIKKITKSIIFHCFPDGLCVSGSAAGSETGNELITEVKSVAGQVPVFCNTGCNAQNVAAKLDCCDGVCVGTAFKTDGKINNTVDAARVAEFMRNVKEYRSQHA